MESETKVSVIMPIYNEEIYLEQCLNSVCAQTLEDIEIICIDDGSTDSSLEILECFAKRDSRFKLLKQRNQYAGNARNLGMQNARGKYLCFLDSDDFFSPKLLEKMYNRAEQDRSEIVICDAQYYDNMTGRYLERKAPVEKNFFPLNTDRFNRNDSAEHLFQITKGWAWDKLFLTSFIQKERLQFAGSRTANDGFFVYMALALAGRITKLGEPLVTQRVNNKNSLANTRDKSWKCGFDMLYDIRTGLLERGLYGLLERTYLNFALEYIVWSFNSMVSWEGKERIYNYIHDAERMLSILNRPLEYYYFPSLYALYKQMTDSSFGSYAAEVISRKEIELSRLTMRQKRLMQTLNKKKWLFPYSKVSRQSTIVLYGAGQVGQDYYKQVSDSGYCSVILWMDKRFEDKNCAALDAACGWIEELGMVDYDKIVLALSRENDMNEATELLLKQGVERQQIIWEI